LKRGLDSLGKTYYPVGSQNKATKVQIEKSKRSNLKLTDERK
jgi:hypothetical protein